MYYIYLNFEYIIVLDEMSVMDYTFNNLTRLGDDSCDKSQRSIQNTSQANYTLTNFRSTDCSMSEPISFATSQPSVFYNIENN